MTATITRPVTPQAGSPARQTAVIPSDKQVAPPLLANGTVIYSPGQNFRYAVIGPICRLYDREELPWPCCRIQWRGKEPSWARIGKRFVIDMSTRHKVSYQVYLLSETGHHVTSELTREPVTLPLTLHWQATLTQEQKRWWWRFRDV